MEVVALICSQKRDHENLENCQANEMHLKEIHWRLRASMENYYPMQLRYRKVELAKYQCSYSNLLIRILFQDSVSLSRSFLSWEDVNSCIWEVGQIFGFEEFIEVLEFCWIDERAGNSDCEIQRASNVSDSTPSLGVGLLKLTLGPCLGRLLKPSSWFCPVDAVSIVHHCPGSLRDQIRLGFWCILCSTFGPHLSWFPIHMFARSSHPAPCLPKAWELDVCAWKFPKSRLWNAGATHEYSHVPREGIAT